MEPGAGVRLLLQAAADRLDHPRCDRGLRARRVLHPAAVAACSTPRPRSPSSRSARRLYDARVGRSRPRSHSRRCPASRCRRGSSRPTCRCSCAGRWRWSAFAALFDDQQLWPALLLGARLRRSGSTPSTRWPGFVLCAARLSGRRRRSAAACCATPAVGGAGARAGADRAQPRSGTPPTALPRSRTRPTTPTGAARCCIPTRRWSSSARSSACSGRSCSPRSCVIALARLAKAASPAADRLLLAFSLPIIAVITAQAFLSRAHANWAAVCLCRGSRAGDRDHGPRGVVGLAQGFVRAALAAFCSC